MQVRAFARIAQNYAVAVSEFIEVMADEGWKRLAEQQGVAYAKTVAEAMNPKLDGDNPAGRTVSV